jgi:transcriptional regulator with XRE-family HTH domain
METKHRTFGEHIRYLREQSGSTLKEVATKIHVDISLLAKIERSERQPTSEFIKSIADFFKVEENSLRREFLSEQIAYKILSEDGDLDILKAAESKVEYLKRIKNE